MVVREHGQVPASQAFVQTDNFFLQNKTLELQDYFYLSVCMMSLKRKNTKKVTTR